MKSPDGKKASIGLLTPPLGKHSVIPLSHLINILSTQYSNIILITGNEGYKNFNNDSRISIYNIFHKENEIKKQYRIFHYLYIQLKIALGLIHVITKSDLFIFFLGGENLILPMIIAKIFRKKIIILFAGSSIHMFYKDNLIFFLRTLRFFNCLLCNKIFLYSKNLIDEWNLERWRQKIVFAHEHYVDFNVFNMKKNYQLRDFIIGFAGRLSEEKGIEQLLHSVPIILSERPDLHFLFIGEGPLRQNIEDYIIKNELYDKITLTGWVPHTELAEYLNQMKLLVIPSNTEGLPNILLESITCGTPVLATPVGAMPDLIIDGISGFIMENNTPYCIAKNVLRAMNSTELEKIIMHGIRFVERDYSFTETVNQWKGHLLSIKYVQ